MPAHIDHKTNPRNGGAGQRPSDISANTIFLACNFGNKRVKGHFDALKRFWEANLPVRVYLSDKVLGEGARDLWQDITQTIKEANLAIFDVTSFRPNVVLELGFALANKQPRQIVICRDLTPGGRTKPEQKDWLLSDIGHLNRIDYRSFEDLDKQLLQHIERMSPVKKFYQLWAEIKRQKIRMGPLYVNETLKLLAELRDKGPISHQDFKSRLKNRGVDAKKLGRLLVRFKLVKPKYGRNRAWKLVD
jgi:hypothetical protein